MGRVLVKCSQGFASVILAGAIIYGMFKLGQVLYRGITNKGSSK